jgi:hypothetical protein
MRGLRARAGRVVLASPGAPSWYLPALLVVALPAPAFASVPAAFPPGPPSSGAGVELLVESCPQVDEQVLRQMLSLEIGDLLLPEAQSEAPRADRLTVRCTDDGQARLTAGGPGRAPALERTVRLGDFPDDATPRVLALAGVELLASIEVLRAPAPAPAASVVRGPAPPPDPAEQTPAVVSDQENPSSSSMSRSLLSRARFALVLMRRAFRSDAGVTAWGASASASSDVNATWAVRCDLDGGAAHSSGDLRTVDTYMLSAGAFWGPRFGRGDLAGVLGFGARLGLTRFAGQPGSLPADYVNASSVLRPWAGPTMMVQIRNGGSGWGLMLYGESGVTVVGAVGSSVQGPIAAVRGIWLTVGGGLSF